MIDPVEHARLRAVEEACLELAAPGVRLTKTGLRTALATPAPVVVDEFADGDFNPTDFG